MKTFKQACDFIKAHDVPVVYADDTTMIVNADCRWFLKQMPGVLVVTDPPFNVGYKYEGYADKLTPAGYDKLLRRTCRAPSVVIHYPEAICTTAIALGQPPKRMAQWVYPSNTPRQHRSVAWFGCAPDFRKGKQPYKNPKDKRIAARILAGQSAKLYDWWEINQVKNVSAEKTEHPCQMPMRVLENIFSITGPTEGTDFIVEPFLGSGTTVLAPRAQGIKAIGFDISRKYCDIAASRIPGA